jgi:hypothetical protein
MGWLPYNHAHKGGLEMTFTLTPPLAQVCPNAYCKAKQWSSIDACELEDISP